MLNGVSRRLMSLCVLVAVFLALLGWSSPVSACECSAPEGLLLDDAIVAAPAVAEVGILTNRDGVWIAEVLTDVKGNLPDQIAILAPEDEVGSAGDDADCGVAWREGTVTGLLLEVNESRGWLTADACSQVEAAAIKDWVAPPGASIATLDLKDPPDVGGWSGWLLVLIGGAAVAYVAKNWRDPAWRNAWSKPNNARNSPVRRPDDPTERGRFER